MSAEKGPWRFVGFKSEAEGRPVQTWYNDLPIEVRDEIFDLVLHLRHRVASLWRPPEFDPLEGEGGISKINPQEIRCEEGSLTYCIYGWRGYPDTWSYTFLHGDREENDEEGKAIAKWRLGELKRGAATVHWFDFEMESYSEIKKKPRNTR